MSTEEEHMPKLNRAPNKKENEKRKQAHSQHKKFKHEESRHFKHGRKRLQTFSGNGKFCPPYKRRKKCSENIVPPTKFLLGGNIRDPLNLNSMQDEEVNRAMNAVTPKSSPLPTPKHRKGRIQVIIPPNSFDPLNLYSMNDEEYEKQLISPTKKNSKRKNKRQKRALSESAKEDIVLNEIEDNIAMLPTILEENDVSSSTEDQICVKDEPKEEKLDSWQKDKEKLKLKGLEEVKDKKIKKLDIKDKIVSPVIPQPGTWKKKKKQQQKPQKFNPKNEQFKYGNYNRYYGYRNPNHVVDLRLTPLAQRKEMFRGLDVLDIGCNTGQVTLAIASRFGVKSMTGIDIDPKLIKIARKNIRHYIKRKESPKNDDLETGEDAEFFPISMPINYGPIAIPGFSKENNHKGFPYNVTFVQGNYVLDDSSLLDSEQPQFDTIMCLSTTKWIHLNFGDDGLKRAFKRMFRQLRPGGILILEPQNWVSYGKKKKLTEQIYKNYHSIKFSPSDFTQYLLSSEVGFTSCEVLSVATHPSKGFQRPIHLYTKAVSEEHRQIIEQRRNQEREERRAMAMKGESRMAMDPYSHLRRMYFDRTPCQYNESRWDYLENAYAPSASYANRTPEKERFATDEYGDRYESIEYNDRYMSELYDPPTPPEIIPPDPEDHHKLGHYDNFMKRYSQGNHVDTDAESGSENPYDSATTSSDDSSLYRIGEPVDLMNRLYGEAPKRDNHSHSGDNVHNVSPSSDISDKSDYYIDHLSPTSNITSDKIDENTVCSNTVSNSQIDASQIADGEDKYCNKVYETPSPQEDNLANDDDKIFNSEIYSSCESSSPDKICKMYGLRASSLNSALRKIIEKEDDRSSPSNERPHGARNDVILQNDVTSDRVEENVYFSSCDSRQYDSSETKTMISETNDLTSPGGEFCDT